MTVSDATLWSADIVWINEDGNEQSTRVYFALPRCFDINTACKAVEKAIDRRRIQHPNMKANSIEKVDSPAHICIPIDVPDYIEEPLS